MSDTRRNRNAIENLPTLSRRQALAVSAAAAAGAVALSGQKAAAEARDEQIGQYAGAGMPWDNGELVMSDTGQTGRFIQHENGKPFFWMADTAWLLHKLSQKELQQYFADRHEKDFNVVQLQVVPGALDFKNYYGNTPFSGQNIRQPDPGYWSNVDYIVDQAARYGIYMGMDAMWSSVVNSGELTADDAAWYGMWLGNRYKDRPNIVWMNGGDARADKVLSIWATLGESIKQVDPNHLITFHPFGRFSSSTWFHNASWLDFNMFQSGHRNYEQSFAAVGPDVIGVELPTYWKGEDNWKYVIEDYKLYPAKPTLDGEPSYERIPQGLHDPTQPFWTDDDARRYAYWSVFSGACGHTYGNGAVMQMHIPSDGPIGAYGVKAYWYEAINDPGAGQMQHLKHLMLSRPYFDRIYDPTVVDGDPGYQHDHLLTTRGQDFLFAYIYTGRSFSLQLGHISGSQLNAWWYSPEDGHSESIGKFSNTGVQVFDPPGASAPGNDWALVLDDASKGYSKPGKIT